MKTLTCIPAYGKDYKSKKEVLEDWNGGKDFLAVGITGQGYVSKNDNLSDVSSIQFRYKKLAQTFIHKV